MVYRVNYNPATNEIVSYQEGGDKDMNECPEGCETIAFDRVFPQMFDGNGNCTMIVKDGQLVYKNEQAVPQPIEE
jgi:hypothetical protein